MDLLNSDMITCPYNKAHQMKASKFAFHIGQCKKQFPNENLRVCRFDNLHIVHVDELHDHETVCTSRTTFDAILSDRLNGKQVVIEPKLEINPMMKQRDWDEEPEMIRKTYNPKSRPAKNQF